MLTPVLFSFYIGELVQIIKDSGCEGTFANEILLALSSFITCG